MYNTTKYLIIFYIILYESLFHIKLVCEYFVQDFNKGRELLKEISSKININEYGQI
jgi:hypothetical protein